MQAFTFSRTINGLCRLIGVLELSLNYIYKSGQIFIYHAYILTTLRTRYMFPRSAALLLVMSMVDI